MTPAEINCLAGLAKKINAAHSKMQQAMKAALGHAVEAGEMLLEAKATLGHGDWLLWLDRNCTVSPRTAQAYMRVARNFPKLEAKSAAVADLTLRDALAQMASHANQLARLPAPAAQAAIEGAETGSLKSSVSRVVTHERILEIQRSRQPTPPLGSVRAPADWKPIPQPEPTAQEIEEGRLLACAQEWIVRGIKQGREAEPGLTTDIILTALNNVYCALQEETGAP
jgi:Protein of unknown function (DUF3102)